jgi:hypothetical protein
MMPNSTENCDPVTQSRALYAVGSRVAPHATAVSAIHPHARATMTLNAISQNSMPAKQPPTKRLKTTKSPPYGEEDVPLPPLEEIPEPPPPLPATEESEAVRKYENQRKRSLETGTYTSSIYVDAFNLALDTVLKEESYLFSEEEAEVFAKYRSLDYEAQHL